MQPQHRHLAAILFTDIVGYTGMMQRHEQQAIAAIRRHKEVLESAVAAHGGEVLKYYGDGSLSIFKSAIEALQCALKVQQALQQEPRVPLRIGLHLGEVVREEHDVYGDGVNLASRIQTLGIAGAVLYSKEFFENIKNHPEFRSRSLGTFEFKNVAEPIEVFALSNEGFPVPRKEEMEGKLKVPPPLPRSGKWSVWAVVLGALLLAAVVFVVSRYWPYKRAAFRNEKSIAVLPFRNESAAREENEYFCNGIMESILNNLSQIKDLHVISRQSVERYRGSNKSTAQIARELGVANIVEGSVQKVGNQVKVNTQLIHARTDKHLWSDEYVREWKDIFEVQSEVAQKIAGELNASITSSEKERIRRVPTRNLAAWDRYQQAHAIFVRWVSSVQPGEAEYQSIQFYCDQAIALDPRLAEALALKGMAYWIRNFETDFLKPRFMDSVAFYGKKALAIDKKSVEGHWLMAVYFMHTGKRQEGWRYLEKAAALNPNYSAIQWYIGVFAIEDGAYEKAIRSLKKVLKLDPYYLWASNVMTSLAWAYLNVGDLEQSEAMARKVLEREKNTAAASGAYHVLTHGYHMQGKKDQAWQTARQWVQIDSSAQLYIAEFYCHYKKDWQTGARLFENLHRQNVGGYSMKGRWGHALWMLGEKTRALQLFNDQIADWKQAVALGRTKNQSHYDLAGVYSVLGQKEKAYQHLRAFDQETDWPWGSAYFIRHDPYFDNLRNDPEFQQIIQQGLQKKTRQRDRIRQLEKEGKL